MTRCRLRCMTRSMAHVLKHTEMNTIDFLAGLLTGFGLGIAACFLIIAYHLFGKRRK